jgi:hypothetical protein
VTLWYFRHQQPLSVPMTRMPKSSRARIMSNSNSSRRPSWAATVPLSDEGLRKGKKSIVLDHSQAVEKLKKLSEAWLRGGPQEMEREFDRLNPDAEKQNAPTSTEPEPNEKTPVT